LVVNFRTLPFSRISSTGPSLSSQAQETSL